MTRFFLSLKTKGQVFLGIIIKRECNNNMPIWKIKPMELAEEIEDSRKNLKDT